MAENKDYQAVSVRGGDENMAVSFKGAGEESERERVGAVKKTLS